MIKEDRGTFKPGHMHQPYPFRSSRGEKNRMAKLTEVEVRKIRERLAAGEDYKDIAKDVKMDNRSIRDIEKFRTWKHLK